ncbi:CAP domain-containing protein [Salibaculum halophilum]|uniref:CAP domain-containing protein n=1 Tax=Salibaculum halophilum TaxID=1914408 RepID=UPI000A1113BC|nr:CAP domain-containing protein [Salibaculum halophilum]
MHRLFALLSILLAGLAACAPVDPARIGPDGLPLPQVYRIDEGDRGAIQFRMLDSLNTLREAAGAPPLTLNARLNAAAATHSRDMAVQNRPWHFGSDGSSPLERLRRVGYSGQLIGETISETFETELQTLAAWMDKPDTRAVLLDDAANEMGFAWFQEDNGKIWWTLVLGNGTRTGPVAQENPVPDLQG